MTIAAGTSNAVPFTVRPGNIHFVATSGKDAGSGSITAPWATIPYARDAIAPGDIVYARNGVAADREDGSGWNGCLVFGGNSGAPGRPKALIVYPGESATIGSLKATAAGGCDVGIRTKGQGENYWTIGGFKIRGSVAISTAAVAHWHFVANDVSCPNGNGQAGCLTFGYKSTSLYIYGNSIHDVATNLNPSAVTALYHGVYFADGSAHIWFGWNEVANVQGCRGIQQNDSSGAAAFDLHIHNNVIHDTQCDGIVMTTVNPAQGTVELYNNLIYNAGKGPNNLEGSGAWSCMNLQGYGPGSGSIEVYHNTLYNCGTFRNPPYSGSNAGLLWITGQPTDKYVHLVNNIVYTPPGIPYIRIYATKEMPCPSYNDCSFVRGSNNLFYGAGSGPENAHLVKSVNADPHFVNKATADFHLSPESPARGAGLQPPASRDKSGTPRNGETGTDIGAFQAATS